LCQKKSFSGNTYHLELELRHGVEAHAQRGDQDQGDGKQGEALHMYKFTTVSTFTTGTAHVNIYHKH
jgi:hypothetical protein